MSFILLPNIDKIKTKTQNTQLRYTHNVKKVTNKKKMNQTNLKHSVGLVLNIGTQSNTSDKVTNIPTRLGLDFLIKYFDYQDSFQKKQKKHKTKTKNESQNQYQSFIFIYIAIVLRSKPMSFTNLESFF